MSFRQAVSVDMCQTYASLPFKMGVGVYFQHQVLSYWFTPVWHMYRASNLGQVLLSQVASLDMSQTGKGAAI